MKKQIKVLVVAVLIGLLAGTLILAFSAINYGFRNGDVRGGVLRFVLVILPMIVAIIIAKVSAKYFGNAHEQK
jgi:ABC-type transport system involved in cytochrome c biogenesis permease component